ncbi:MAG: tRNA (adenosine(37)-N6)-dimethylallyltransferase MiaA [bacterium]
MTLVIIAGPTAVGKSEVAFEIAKELKGEIVSADSRQIYRFMNIGTAKPSSAFLDKIPHHLIDIINPDEEFSASLFKELAQEKIADISSRRKIPILTGGCGLYINVITQGLFPLSPSSKELRKKLGTKCSLLELYQKLREVDLETALKLSPNDKFRIIRALEVYYLTGKKISRLRKEETIKNNYRSLSIGLTVDRSLLYKKINERVEKMFKDGFLEEVKGLIKMGYSEDLSSMMSLGYKQVVKHLKEEISLEEAKLSIEKETRNYAKRQVTWFKNKEKLKWFSPGEVSKIIEEVRIFSNL